MDDIHANISCCQNSEIGGERDGGRDGGGGCSLQAPWLSETAWVGGDGGSYHATQFHRAAGIKPQKY